jgi:hypothetical protein
MTDFYSTRTTQSWNLPAVACPSDLFGPTQTQVEHTQGDEDLPLLLPHEEPESEASEDDETLQDLAACQSSHLKTEKKKDPKKGPKKMRKKKPRKEKIPSLQPFAVTHLAPAPLAPQMDILQEYHQCLSSTAANGASVTLETVVNGHASAPCWEK